MNGEQKIEAARAFVNSSHLGKSAFRELDRAILIIRDLLAVFEEAHSRETVHSYGIPVHIEEVHTPTDGEREAAITEAYNAVTGQDDDSWGPDKTLAAMKKLWDVAAGFHRAAPAADDEREALVGAIEDLAVEENQFDVLAAEGIADRVLAWMQKQGFHRTVQGEPSALRARIQQLVDNQQSWIDAGRSGQAISRDAMRRAALPDVLRALADLCDAGRVMFDKEGWFTLAESAVSEDGGAR